MIGSVPINYLITEEVSEPRTPYLGLQAHEPILIAAMS